MKKGLLHILCFVSVMAFGQQQATSYSEFDSSEMKNATTKTESISVSETRVGGTPSFTSLVDYLANCSGAVNFPVEDFTGGAQAGVNGCGTTISSAGDGCFTAGELIDGFSVESGAGDTVLLNSGFLPNQTSELVGADTFTDFTIVNFTGVDPVLSAGFNVYNNLDADTEIRIFDSGNTLVDTFTLSGPVGTELYFAFNATVSILRVEIEGANASGELVGNLRFGDCSASAAEGSIFFTGSWDGEIWEANANGTGTPTLLYDSSSGVDTFGPVGIEVDEFTGTLYYAGGNTSEIFSAPVDGSGPITAIPGLDEGNEHHEFEIDYDNGLVYYTSAEGGLWAGNLDGTGSATNLVNTVDVIAGVTLDSTNGVLYFTNGDDGDIGVVNIDGTGLDVNFIVADNPRGLTVDEAAGIVYFVDRNLNGGGVHSAPTDGSSGPTLVYSLQSGTIPYGIDIDPQTGFLFWTEFENPNVVFPFSDFILTAEADGSGTPTIIFSGDFGSVRGIAAGRNIRKITNDVCIGAEALACGATVTGDTSTNTDQGGANASPDAWYSYTGSGFEEIITVSLCDGGTTYDSLLTIFDSCGGAVVADNDDSCDLQSEVTFTSDGTTTYFIAVEGFGTNAGAYSLALTCVVPLDECADAGTISCGETVLGSTANGATPDLGVPDCGEGNESPGVWYRIDDTSGLVTDYTVSLCDGGTTYDSKLVVYSGDCGTLVCVAENDDSCGLQSEVTFQGDGSSTYYILVNGFGTGNSGDFSLNLSCAPIPPINDMIANSIDVDEAGLPYTDPAVPMPAATTEAGGTPADCDNAGVLGVWYNFVPELNGTATAEVISPAGYTSVTFYTAPDENAVETDLTLVDWFDNQCVPGADASIPVVAGQAYYVYVANHDGITDIVIDGDFFLGVGDGEIVGFNYYPNPTDNVLNLNAAGNIESATIYNILGQEVLSRTFNSNNAQLDVSNLSVGTYIMKVMVDGELGIYKIVKE